MLPCAWSPTINKGICFLSELSSFFHALFGVRYESCFNIGISEQRIEQAKKIQRGQEYKKNPSLIPIQRLPIPNKTVTRTHREQQPLVDWETDER
jgi:hypothetical protein